MLTVDNAPCRYQDMETAESMAQKLHGFRVYHPDDRTRLLFASLNHVELLITSCGVGSCGLQQALQVSKSVTFFSFRANGSVSGRLFIGIEVDESISILHCINCASIKGFVC